MVLDEAMGGGIHSGIQHADLSAVGRDGWGTALSTSHSPVMISLSTTRTMPADSSFAVRSFACRLFSRWACGSVPPCRAGRAWPGRAGRPGWAGQPGESGQTEPGWASRAEHEPTGAANSKPAQPSQPAETSQNESGRAEPAEPNPGRPNQARPGGRARRAGKPGRVEPSRAGSDRAELGRALAALAGRAGRAGPGTAEQG